MNTGEESKDEEEKISKYRNKVAEKEREIRLNDEALYREHGLGLDTGNY